MRWMPLLRLPLQDDPCKTYTSRAHLADVKTNTCADGSLSGVAGGLPGYLPQQQQYYQHRPDQQQPPTSATAGSPFSSTVGFLQPRLMQEEQRQVGVLSPRELRLLNPKAVLLSCSTGSCSSPLSLARWRHQMSFPLPWCFCAGKRYHNGLTQQLGYARPSDTSRYRLYKPTWVCMCRAGTSASGAIASAEAPAAQVSRAHAPCLPAGQQRRVSLSPDSLSLPAQFVRANMTLRHTSCKRAVSPRVLCSTDVRDMFQPSRPRANSRAATVGPRSSAVAAPPNASAPDPQVGRRAGGGGPAAGGVGGGAPPPDGAAEAAPGAARGGFCSHLQGLSGLRPGQGLTMWVRCQHMSEHHIGVVVAECLENRDLRC